MEVTELVADKELNVKLNYYVDKDDVLKRMGMVCKERRQWLKSLGEKEGGSVHETINWLSETIAYAHQGDAWVTGNPATNKTPQTYIKDANTSFRATKLQTRNR